MPYIGITGFTDNEQVKAVVGHRGQLWYPYVMVGVITSDKTLLGEEAKWPKRNPPKEDLGKIFEPYAHSLNLIHHHTTDQESLLEQMLQIDQLAGSYMDGFQLNIPWPNAKTIEKYLARNLTFGNKRTVVLQCGRRALEQFDRDPKRIAEVVHHNYEGLADYVLIDPSGGKGEEIDLSFARDCLNEIFSRCRNVCPGIAGGFSAEKVKERLTWLWQDTLEPYSIDAEGRLRDKDDNLDIPACRKFLQEAISRYMP